MTSRIAAAGGVRASEQQRGVLATIAPGGSPQAKPVGFHYDAEGGTVDISGYEMERSGKFRNVGANLLIAFTVEDVPDPNGARKGFGSWRSGAAANRSGTTSP